MRKNSLKARKCVAAVLVLVLCLANANIVSAAESGNNYPEKKEGLNESATGNVENDSSIEQPEEIVPEQSEEIVPEQPVEPDNEEQDVLEGKEETEVQLQEAAPEDNKENIQPDTKDVKFETTLKGICILDEGTWLNVGVDYESTDPDVEFVWMQYDVSANNWSYVSWASPSNWTKWKPQKPGDYWISVQARMSDGSTTTYTYAYRWQGIVTQLSGIYILANGNQYDMGICYNSNDSNIQFRWKLYDLQKKQWTLLQDKSSGNWTTWIPSVAGDYWIHVEAIDSWGGVTTYTLPFRFSGVKTQLNGISVIERKNHVDIGVGYTSNDSKLKFRWLLYDVSEQRWTQISDWSKGNWVSWQPQKTGEYWFWVEAKGTTDEVKQMSYVYKVSGARILSFTAGPDTPNWVGANIKLNGTYWDYKDEVQSERFLIWDGRNWSVMNSDAGKAEWTPTALGNYLLCYEIYGENGRLIAQSFKAYNIEKPYVNLGGMYVQHNGNRNYSMAINYNTNDRAIRFRWLVYNLSTGQWNVIKDWNTTNGANWHAPGPGEYWLHVEAILHDGTTQHVTLPYSIIQYPMDVQAMIMNANMYSSSTGYIALVNRSTHKVGIFRGWQGNWDPIQYWDCADGKASTPTVSGVFTVGSRGYYFDSGAARCFWWTQFYGDYLFHSVLYNRNGTLQDGRVGVALSHGCVRLQIENAKWIYDNIPSGTTVVVY